MSGEGKTSEIRREKLRNQNAENKNEVGAKISHLWNREKVKQLVRVLTAAGPRFVGVRSFLAYKLWVHSFVFFGNVAWC